MRRQRSDEANIWLAYSDLFGGILLVLSVVCGYEIHNVHNISSNNAQLRMELQAANDKVSRLEKSLYDAQDKAIEVLTRVQDQINSRHADSKWKVKVEGTQLIIPADITFQFGSYYIRPEAKQWLLEIGQAIGGSIALLDNDRAKIAIEIQGYTDAYPMGQSLPNIPSNWELSSRRATEIVRIFQDNGLIDPRVFRVHAVGAAEYETLNENYENGILRDYTQLEYLRKIKIRIIPDYEQILSSLRK